MDSIRIALTSCSCMFAGALLGAFLRKFVPAEQLSADSRDVVKIGAGLIATMAALVLGLMVSSAKGSFDKVSDGLTHIAANFAYLDRILHLYGPETDDARAKLRQNLAARIQQIWPTNKVPAGGLSGVETSNEQEALGDMLRKLSPQDESQRILKGVALQVYDDGMKLKWTLVEQTHASIPTVFLVILVFWFTLLFGVLTLLAPRNLTVLVVMLLCAVSVSGGIVLTLDMNRPFEGLVKVSSGPLENALKNLGR